MYDKISTWSLVCFYLLANQKHLPRRLIVSGKTVRAVLAKTRSLQNAPTLFTLMEGRKPSTSIIFSVKTFYRQPQSLGSCTKDWLEISKHPARWSAKTQTKQHVNHWGLSLRGIVPSNRTTLWMGSIKEIKRKYEQKLNRWLADLDVNELKKKWVVNISGRLQDNEISLLRKGLNFAITPHTVPMKVDSLLLKPQYATCLEKTRTQLERRFTEL